MAGRKHRVAGGRDSLDVVHSDKARYVRQVFDTIADRYDRMNVLMTAGLIYYWHWVLARSTGLRPGQQALDVACGTGELSLIMARQVAPVRLAAPLPRRPGAAPTAVTVSSPPLQGRGQRIEGGTPATGSATVATAAAVPPASTATLSQGRVIGIDFSPDMLAVAREKVARTPYRSVIDLRYGDALRLPFADCTFDCVATGFALRNVTDIRQALAEMARVTRPGGRVLCLELSHPTPWLAGAYLLYFRHVVPLLGRWAARRFERQFGREHPLPPYAWLPASLAEIPSQEELAKIMQEVGLSPVRYRNLTGGVVALHIGFKPEPGATGSY
ncbi:MAG: class I SAM-dependent methyltransferase [Limnochordaceae bacterium]|nr:class I SAM-dependent methyltransferase [Limnochordaceae bacterium]